MMLGHWILCQSRTSEETRNHTIYLNRENWGGDCGTQVLGHCSGRKTQVTEYMQDAAAIVRAQQSKRKGLWLLASRSLEKRSIRVGAHISGDGVPASSLISRKGHNEAASGGIGITTNQNNYYWKQGHCVEGHCWGDTNRDNRREHVPGPSQISRLPLWFLTGEMWQGAG